jgi:hypothetical protein
MRLLALMSSKGVKKAALKSGFCGQCNQWFCEPRCAHAVVCFSIMLNNSYMIIAIAPTTTKPAKAKPICMAEPAEISK